MHMKSKQKDPPLLSALHPLKFPFLGGQEQHSWHPLIAQYCHANQSLIPPEALDVIPVLEGPSSWILGLTLHIVLVNFWDFHGHQIQHFWWSVLRLQRTSWRFGCQKVWIWISADWNRLSIDPLHPAGGPFKDIWGDWGSKWVLHPLLPFQSEQRSLQVWVPLPQSMEKSNWEAQVVELPK